MSAAAERAALAATGRNLLAASGSAGERRATGLTGSTDMPPPTAFTALHGTPEWLLRPADEQVRLAEIVAVRALAPALARSIDGDWLGSLAKAVGDDAVDWAIGRGADGEDATVAPIAPDALAARGFAILRRELPASMLGYLAWAPADRTAPPAPGVVADALAFVAERAA